MSKKNKKKAMRAAMQVLEAKQAQNAPVGPAPQRMQETPKNSLGAWIEREGDMRPAVDKVFELARISRENSTKKEYIFAQPAFKAIPESARQGVMDSYSDYFACHAPKLAGISTFLGYSFLSFLAQDGMISNAITTIADEMTRKWGEVTCSAENSEDKIKFIEEQLKDLSTSSVFQEAMIYTGFFGGALIYLDVRGEDGIEPDAAELETPLYKPGAPDFNKAKLAGKRLYGLKAIEPINIAPGAFNSTDPTKQNFYEPDYYFVLGKRIHASRFLKIVENTPPMVLKPVYQFFGIPQAQLALEYVQDFYENKRSTTRLVKKFSLTYIKTDTQALLGTGSGGVQARIKTFAKYRDNDGIGVFDINEEEIGQINTPLSGLKEIWYANLEQIPMIFKIPIIKMLGQTPGGLNATGENDMRNFYDNINTKQKKVFSKEVLKLLNIICFCASLDTAGLDFTWISLYEPTPKEQADINLIKANTDAVLHSVGALGNDDIAKRISADKTSGYDGIEVPELVNPEGFETGAGEEELTEETIIHDEFKEGDHPRDKDGKFSSGRGEGNSTNSQGKDTLSRIISASPVEVKAQASQKEAFDALYKLAGKDLNNDETGIKAQINSEQRNKIISEKAVGKSIFNGFTREQHYAVAEQIDKLYQNAILIKKRGDKYGDTNIKSIKEFVSPFKVKKDDIPNYAHFLLKESEEHGHRIYTLELQALEKVKGVMDCLL
ncbi:MAG: anti-CBASS protein Acb1 family protein [Candidatus Avelusimicrobium sp.]|uniref:anti-CBASS protein Acb1 family protein n=1 Tax=Candidatus Avelusimicrobium sp. TaxID=3048833 RepID=UPI003F026D71